MCVLRIREKRKVTFQRIDNYPRISSCNVTEREDSIKNREIKINYNSAEHITHGGVFRA